MLQTARARTDRFLQIGEVFVKHGLGFLLGGLDQAWAAPLRRVRLLDPQRRYSQAQHLRMALEELGPTFIKLGQLASTRGDLLPASYTQELALLQDSSPAVSYEELVGQFAGCPEETMLGRFTSIDPTPLATGSIGQVHAAVLDGRDVVVKIRKPGVREAVRQDLDILVDLAKLLNRYVPAARRLDAVELARQFSHSMEEELDYTLEGTHCDRFADFFREDPWIRVPQMHWETTTASLLTQDRVRGLKIGDLDALDAAGVDRHQLAVAATEALCRMVFQLGLFHADPHPGNFFVHPDGSITIIDFGMVGELSEQFRDRLVPLLIGVTTGNARQAARATIKLTAAPGSSARAAEIEPDLERIISAYSGRSLEDLDLGALLADVLGMLHRHDLVLPPEAALLVKMIATAESLGTSLDPQFDIVAVLTPFARAYVAGRMGWESMTRRLRGAAQEALSMGLDAPDTARRIMAVIENGGFDVHLRAEELEELIGRIEVVGNRLVAGAVLAAIVNGTSHIVAADAERFRSWHPALLGAGAAGAGMISGWFAWSFRPRRHRRGG